MNLSSNDSMPPPAAPGLLPSPSTVAALVSARAGEKTVPFLKSLMEMIIRSNDVISFVPGVRSSNGVNTPGRIIIHDRNRLQREVLPFYFNHASFASLRRQLSYFSFVRLGNIRGRSNGSVTYINHNVYALSDILWLKRRSVGDNPTVSASAAGSTAADSSAPTQESDTQGMQMKSIRKQSKIQEHDTTSKDVASAISSGKMHARETNHDLDDNYHQSESFTSITLGTTSRAVRAPRQRVSKKEVGNAKYKRNFRKRRSQIERLLCNNEIVPFIHVSVQLLDTKCMLKEDDQQVDTTSVKKKKKRKKKKVRRSKDCRGKTGQPKSDEKPETSSSNSSEENMQTDKEPNSSTSSSNEPNSSTSSSNDGAVSSQMDSQSPLSLSGSDPNSG